MIKKLTSLCLVFSSSLALAHEGHGMADNNWHSLFHIMFWLLVAAVAVKGYRWWQIKGKYKYRQK
ncbi:MAG: hypothetical protein NWQ54_09500 [Paraglaciecola sp.]|uniref:hypothetical protein n=1 Tax=Paraglaciecola sp. TaxID=1920173 RepID=UPI00273EB9C6|nr:hypothetical protein [Paraglaciecola sp.]MDP5029543.1 hypothetical protein [Paraglaciecola sp.]MDP5131110.1 hypothetical protein [Paraglaciecola sp.]